VVKSQNANGINAKLGDSNMTSANRYRVMHKFWLDLKKENEDWLDEQINLLKRSRKFTLVLRDALRLILDLRAGRLDVLFELFPWVKENMEQSPSTTTDLERQLERLEVMLKEQGSISVSPGSYPVLKSSSVTPAVMIKNVPAADAGTIADDFLAFIQ
jgi:hypothetical protein